MDIEKPTFGELAFFFAACCALIVLSKLDRVRRSLGL